MVTGSAGYVSPGEGKVSWSQFSTPGTLSAGRGEDEVLCSPSSHDHAIAATLPVTASVLLLAPEFRCGHCNGCGAPSRVWFGSGSRLFPEWLLLWLTDLDSACFGVTAVAFG